MFQRIVSFLDWFFNGPFYKPPTDKQIQAFSVKPDEDNIIYIDESEEPTSLDLPSAEEFSDGDDNTNAIWLPEEDEDSEELMWLPEEDEDIFSQNHWKKHSEPRHVLEEEEDCEFVADGYSLLNYVNQKSASQSGSGDKPRSRLPATCFQPTNRSRFNR